MTLLNEGPALGPATGRPWAAWAWGVLLGLPLLESDLGQAGQEPRISSRPQQRGYADVMETREFPPARIEDIAHRHGAVEVRVFGSWLRKASGGPRDLDLLVRFEPGRDLLDLVALKQEVEEAVGIPVDVVTEEGLSPYLRDTILAEARPLGA